MKIFYYVRTSQSKRRVGFVHYLLVFKENIKLKIYKNISKKFFQETAKKLAGESFDDPLRLAEFKAGLYRTHTLLWIICTKIHRLCKIHAVQNTNDKRKKVYTN